MAKKSQKELRDYGCVAKVARIINENQSTLRSAIKRDLVASEELGCGTRVVSIASAHAWADSERKSGPKPLR